MSLEAVPYLLNAIGIALAPDVWECVKNDLGVCANCSEAVAAAGESQSSGARVTVLDSIVDATPESSCRISELHEENRRLREENALLRKKLSTRDKTIANLRSRLKCNARKVKRREKKVINAKQHSDTLALELKQKQLKRGCGRYFCVRGGFNVALGRSLTNTAAYCVGLIMGTDADKKTIRNWELRLRAALQAAHREWLRAKECELADRGGFVVHRIRSDATNALAWKVNVTEVPCPTVKQSHATVQPNVAQCVRRRFPRRVWTQTSRDAYLPFVLGIAKGSSSCVPFIFRRPEML